MIRESEHAQSKADFINKVNIALKEANETEFNSIIEECRELIRLTASIVKTTKLSIEN